MNRLSAICLTVLVSGAALLSVGATYAQTVTMAEPNGGLKIEDFATQLGSYNEQDIADLVNATTVSVIAFDSAWAKPNKALQMLGDDAQEINLLREGLKANAKAVKLLTDNDISANHVVDVVSDGKGAVQLYVL